MSANAVISAVLESFGSPTNISLNFHTNQGDPVGGCIVIEDEDEDGTKCIVDLQWELFKLGMALEQHPERLLIVFALTGILRYRAHDS